jgi:hypothetical protein
MIGWMTIAEHAAGLGWLLIACAGLVAAQATLLEHGQ